MLERDVCLSEGEERVESRERVEREEDREEEYGHRHMDIDIKNKRRTKVRRFYVPTKFENTFNMLQSILKREGINFSQWVREQTEGYVRLHEPGNPQQRLDIILKLGKAFHSPSKICGFRDCMRDVVGVALYLPRNEEYGYCLVHARLIKENSDLWKVLK
jgi:hypothetical protein